MDVWTRLSDDAIVVKKDRILRFDCPRGEYALVLKHSSREMITVRFEDKEELWPIQTKAIKGSSYKLTGLADWVPEILGKICWFELVVGTESSITYWGDQVIYRTDNAKA